MERHAWLCCEWRQALARRRGRVRLEVTNSGPTIERSALNQIFDPFKRGPA